MRVYACVFSIIGRLVVVSARRPRYATRTSARRGGGGHSQAAGDANEREKGRAVRREGQDEATIRRIHCSPFGRTVAATTPTNEYVYVRVLRTNTTLYSGYLSRIGRYLPVPIYTSTSTSTSSLSRRLLHRKLKSEPMLLVGLLSSG